MANNRDSLEARLGELRAAIDRTDDDILARLNHRARLVGEVADLKTALEVPFYVPSRERQIADRLSATNPGPFPTEAIRSVFQEIFSACLTLERRVRVAYLGPEGTFSQMAVKQQFGLAARATPIGSIPGVFEEVERGNADFGVVPVENTTEGGIIHTFDTFLDSDLKISAEIAVQIHMCLLARAGVELADIERVYSHPRRCRTVPSLARQQLAPRDHRRVTLDGRRRAPGARRRARGGGGGGDCRSPLRPHRRPPQHRRFLAQHDALPGGGARAGRAHRARQDLDAAGDARRAGNLVSRSRRVGRARAQHDQDREPSFEAAARGNTSSSSTSTDISATPWWPPRWPRWRSPASRSRSSVRTRAPSRSPDSVAPRARPR